MSTEDSICKANETNIKKPSDIMYWIKYAVEAK